MKNVKAFQKLSPGEIYPSGWMKRQLEIQAAGLAGNLDKVWPDVKDSGWLGAAKPTRGKGSPAGWTDLFPSRIF